MSLILLLGCVVGPGGAPLAVDADPEWFSAEVQPVFEARCANASCHGDPGRPLEIYATHRHRLDPADVYLDAGLTEEELHLNFLKASAFVAELTALPGVTADDCSLLTKPLDPDDGGAEHGGLVQFFDTEERDYQALRAWIDDALQELP